MAKFEYRTMVYDTHGMMGGKINEKDFQDKLNMFGENGWELVSSVATNQGNGYTRSIISIFKKKIRSEFKDG